MFYCIGQMESLYNPFHLFEGRSATHGFMIKIQHFKNFVFTCRLINLYISYFS
mgnify:FL=1